MKHKPINITSQQRDNLMRLANFLGQQYGYNRAPYGFDMGAFMHTRDGAQILQATKKYDQCGTVCCAVGHGPAAGIAPRDNESWLVYADRVFGTSPTTEYGSDTYMWCFAGTWATRDNTPIGAVRRIRYMLEHGIPDMSGLCTALPTWDRDWYTANINPDMGAY